MGTTCGRHNKRTSPVSMISISRRQMAALWGFKCETADWDHTIMLKKKGGTCKVHREREELDFNASVSGKIKRRVKT